MNANEHFEMIADEFYLDTGYLRPGKSESPVAWYEGRDREREVAFEVWCKMRKKIETLRAEVERLIKANEHWHERVKALKENESRLALLEAVVAAARGLSASHVDQWGSMTNCGCPICAALAALDKEGK